MNFNKLFLSILFGFLIVNLIHADGTPLTSGELSVSAGGITGSLYDVDSQGYLDSSHQPQITTAPFKTISVTSFEVVRPPKYEKLLKDYPNLLFDLSKASFNFASDFEVISSDYFDIKVSNGVFNIIPKVTGPSYFNFLGYATKYTDPATGTVSDKLVYHFRIHFTGIKSDSQDTTPKQYILDVEVPLSPVAPVLFLPNYDNTKYINDKASDKRGVGNYFFILADSTIHRFVKYDFIFKLDDYKVPLDASLEAEAAATAQTQAQSDFDGKLSQVSDKFQNMQLPKSEYITRELDRFYAYVNGQVKRSYTDYISVENFRKILIKAGDDNRYFFDKYFNIKTTPEQKHTLLEEYISKELQKLTFSDFVHYYDLQKLPLAGVSRNSRGLSFAVKFPVDVGTNSPLTSVGVAYGFGLKPGDFVDVLQLGAQISSPLSITSSAISTPGVTSSSAYTSGSIYFAGLSRYINNYNNVVGKFSWGDDPVSGETYLAGISGNYQIMNLKELFAESPNLGLSVSSSCSLTGTKSSNQRTFGLNIGGGVTIPIADALSAIVGVNKNIAQDPKYTNFYFKTRGCFGLDNQQEFTSNVELNPVANFDDSISASAYKGKAEFLYSNRGLSFGVYTLIPQSGNPTTGITLGYRLGAPGR